jgi:AbiV family abortive infection protein
MNKHQSILAKIRRVAAAAFENAVRLHEDAILLFKEERVPSALHTSALSIEEIGKYFMHEDVWWHNNIGSKWTIEMIQEFLSTSYSHTAKQRWFASQAEGPYLSKPLLRILQEGQLEQIKQKATYVGFPRKGKSIDFTRRMISPLHISKKTAEGLITLVNDYFVVLAIGIRKACFILDIPEIDDWLAQKEFEDHFVDLWPLMRPSAKRYADRLLRYEDEER